MKKLFFTILILCLIFSFGFAQGHKDGAHKGGGLIQLQEGAATGDIIYWNGSAWTLLNIGSNTYVLTSDGTTVSWAASGSSDSAWTSARIDTLTSGNDTDNVTGRYIIEISDGDLMEITGNTSDIMLFKDASGGYSFDDDLIVATVLKLGGSAAPYFSSGKDANGTFFEQIGNSTSNEDLRFTSSTSGDMANYSFFRIDPTDGFAFYPVGTGNYRVGIGTETPSGRLTVDSNKGTINLAEFINADDGAVGSDSTAYFDKLGDLWLGDSNAQIAKIDTVETGGDVVRWVKLTVGGVDFFAVADTSIIVN